MQYFRRKMSSELINQSIIREHLTSSEVMEKEDEIKENWCSKDCAGPLFAEKDDPNFSFEHLRVNLQCTRIYSRVLFANMISPLKIGRIWILAYVIYCPMKRVLHM